MTPSSPRQPHLEVLLAALIFFSHAYFYNGVGGNQNARLDPAYSFVEPGTPWTGTFLMENFASTGAQIGNSQDWAEGHGKRYSSKAPGTIWAGTLVYFGLFYVERFIGIDATHLRPAVFNSYAINLAVSVLFVTLASIALFRFLGGGINALIQTYVFAFATLILPFDSQLWGHPTAAAFLVLSLTSRNRPGRSGLFAALAAVTDYIAGVGLIFGAILLLDPNDRSLRKSRWHRLFTYGLGAAPPLIAMFAYHWACFGSGFTVASSRAFPMYGALPGYNAWGMGGLSPEAMVELLFLRRRGVFFYMPVLLMVFTAIVPLLKNQVTRFFTICSLGTVLLMTASVSTMAIWWGGWSSGPRYLIVALPYLILLMPSWNQLRWPTQIVFATLGLVSFFNMICITTVNPMAHEGYRSPLFEYLYPSFWAGSFQQNRSVLRDFYQPAQTAAASFNLGEKLLGIGTRTSALLLSALLLAGFVFLASRLRKSPASTIEEI